MGSKTHVTMKFLQPFRGIGNNERNCVIKIGGEKGESGPYDLLLMSLGSCLYSTFEDILEKKKLTFEKLEIDISGTKRSEVPTTLEYCNVIFSTKTDDDNKKAFIKSLELACKYCSIYNTLTHVAEMNAEIDFI
jgi:putative redox protein